MKKAFLALVLTITAGLAYSETGGVHLDPFTPDASNKASMQEGLRTFMDYCAGCHSLGYARYNRVARDLDIPEDIFMDNIVFADGARFGDLMHFAMATADGKKWFGAPPPDLTNVTRVRGADWVYTYLRSFYADDSRPWGVNNTVFPGVGMPHVLLPLQGLCATAPHHAGGEAYDPLTGRELHEGSCEVQAVEGTLNEEEFDEVVYNLVNFLDYMGEPYKSDRKRLGWYVFAFLTVLLIPAVLLQRELHKDIH